MTIPVFAGPTASGKSAASLALARLLKGEIVNADSRQVYKRLDAGTSKPPLQDRMEIPHHLYDFLEPDQPYNAGLYARQARDAIRSIAARGSSAIVAGGTGLYLQALFDGLAELPKGDEDLRREFRRLAEEKGKEFLHQMLERADPESAAKIPYQNVHRVARALEVHRLTGKPLSEHHRNAAAEPFEHPPAFFALRWEREALRRRIRDRTRSLLPGLIREAETLRELGFKPEAPACESLGYRDAFRFLDGALTREELFEKVTLDTLHYAKRQATWFRRDPRIRWIPASEPFDPEKAARAAFDIISR